MEPFDLNTLVLLTHIAEAGSFAAAARRSGIPKSTLSRRVRELEKELGIRILQRTSRALSFTDPGRLLLERARALTTIAERTRRELRAHTTDVVGLVRVTASVSFGEHFLSPIVTAFMRQHPQVQLELLLTEKRVDLLEQGIDLAVRIGQPVPTDSLIARRLGETRMQLCAAPSYLTRAGTPQEPVELADHALLHYRGSSRLTEWSLVSDGEHCTVRFKPVLEVNSHPTLRDAARAGLGIAFLPPPFSDELIRSGELVQVLPRWRSRAAWLYIAYPSREHQPMAVQAFTTFLRERLTPEWLQHGEPDPGPSDPGMGRSDA